MSRDGTRSPFLFSNLNKPTLFDTSSFSREKTALNETFKCNSTVAAKIKDAARKLEWPPNYKVVITRKGMDEVARHIENEGIFTFDLETSGLNPWRDRIFCCSIYVPHSGAYLIPFGHQMMDNGRIGDFQEAFGDAFSYEHYRRINHNVKFDAHFIEEQLGMKVGPLHCDTMLQAWVINCNDAHGLKELCDQYDIDDGGENYRKQFGKTAWSVIDPKLAAYYACKDAELAYQLYVKQNEILERKPKLKRVFWELDMPTLNLTYEMERHGIRVDMEYVEHTLKPTIYNEYDECVERLAPYVQPYLDARGDKENSVVDVLESNKKLFEYAFGYLKLPLKKGVTLKEHPKTKKLHKTLDKNAIASLEDDHEFVRLLGDYRKVATVKKMFVDTLPYMVVNGRIHPTINVVGARTSRMSMSDPNLQQVPSRMGALVRNMFIPDDGYIFGSLDYSQQESRLMAHFSEDAGLIRIFENDLDLYNETAIELFDLPSNYKFDKNDPRRRDTKALVLGLGFGMGGAKYARQVGIPKQEGFERHEKYHSKFPGVRAYQNRATKFAEQHGYIVTLLGHERPLPFINSPDKGLKSKAERAAGNTPIQGSAADQVKLAALKTKFLIDRDEWPVFLSLMIHDEHLYQMREDWVKRERDKGVEQIRQTLETALPLKVPMKCGLVFETRWGTEIDADKLEVLDSLED